MIQTKYLISLVFLFSSRANLIAFGPKLLNLGQALLQKFNDSLNKNSRTLESLSIAETIRLSKEQAERNQTFNSIKSNFDKVNEQNKQSSAKRKVVEEKLKETNNSNDSLSKKLQEYKDQVQSSYREEVKATTQELQKSANELSQKFKSTWEEQDQKIQQILREIQSSNREKIEKLAKEIEGLPERIFLDSVQSKLA